MLMFYYILGQIVFGVLFYLYVENPPIELISHSKNPLKAYEGFIRMAEANNTMDHGLTLEEITFLYEDYHENLEEKSMLKLLPLLISSDSNLSELTSLNSLLCSLSATLSNLGLFL